MALMESAIGGIAVTVLETVLRAGGAAAQQIRGAYNDTQAKQKVLAAAKNYEERYRKRHCQVKVMPGLMREPLPLEDIYTAVKLLDDNSIRYFAGLDDLEEIHRNKRKRSFRPWKAERQDGMKAVNEEQYLMVLGRPGIGKSTFLRKIGLESLKTNGEINKNRIPILIELRKIRDFNVDFAQEITKEFEICGFPSAKNFAEQMLVQGMLMVLLDGLDELPQKSINQVIGNLEDFVDTYDQNSFVVSCRTAVYNSGTIIPLQRFTDITLAEFDDEQIKQAITSWFNVGSSIELETAYSLWETLQQSRYELVKELAQTPLLLTFICLAYQTERRIPSKLSALHGKALDILLSEWSPRRAIYNPEHEILNSDAKKKFLSELAFNNFKSDRLFFLKEDVIFHVRKFIDEEKVKSPIELDPSEILRAIENCQGILSSQALNIYSFSHLALQEYLAALYLSRLNNCDCIIVRNLEDRRWKDVIVLTVGMSQHPSLILSEMLKRIHVIASKNRKVSSLLEWASRISSESASVYKAASVRAALMHCAICLMIAFLSFLQSRRIADIEFRFHSPIIASAMFRSKKIALMIDPNIATGPVNEYEFNYADSTSRKAFAASTSTYMALLIMLNKMNPDTSIYNSIFNGIFSEMSHLEAILGPHKISNLSKKLRYLQVKMPAKNMHKNTWDAWSQEFLLIWSEVIGLDIHEIKSEISDIKALDNYLYLVELLLSCQEASVSLRQQDWAQLEDLLLIS